MAPITKQWHLADTALVRAKKGFRVSCWKDLNKAVLRNEWEKKLHGNEWEKMITKRMNNLDLLRCVACIAVIMLHSIGALMTNQQISIGERFLGLTANSLSRFAVPCFFLLSGFFTLDRNHDRRFFFGALKNIILPAILAKGLYLAIDLRAGLDDVVTILQKTFLLGTSSSYHMWFVLSIILIYAISPMLKSIKQFLMAKSVAGYVGFAVVMLVTGIILFYFT